MTFPHPCETIALDACAVVAETLPQMTAELAAAQTPVALAARYRTLLEIGYGRTGGSALDRMMVMRHLLHTTATRGEPAARRAARRLRPRGSVSGPSPSEHAFQHVHSDH